MSKRTAFIIVTLLLIGFYIVSLTAVLQKSPTADEPIHTLAAILQAREHDFRVATDVPPFWHYVATAPHWFRHIEFVRDANWERLIRGPEGLWPWAYQTLYKTPANNADTLINESRAAVLLFGVALGAILAWFAYLVAGPIAAVVTAAFYCLDPNFLGHAGLVKNDVPLTCIWAWFMLATLYVGRRATWRNVLALAIACGGAFGTKLSGIIVVPLVICLLALRAVIVPAPWIVFGRELTTRGKRVVGAGLIIALLAIISYVQLWAVYGFRYRMAPGNETILDDAAVLDYLARREIYAKGFTATPQMLADWKAPPATRFLMWFEKLHFVPQGWSKGLFETQGMNTGRLSFLMGQIKMGGTWYYFPLAMLFKSPIGLILATVFAVIWIFFNRKKIYRQVESAGQSVGWTALCLLFPFSVYMYLTFTADLNLGLRHVFPLFATIFILIGVACARLISQFPRAGVAFVSLLIAGVGVETARAFPDYIAFFNTAVGGARGGLYLLGDSNLDWGQDLSTLGRWRKDHLDRPLYHTAWTTVSSPWYGVDGDRISGHDGEFGTDIELDKVKPPCYLAVFANTLQGTFMNPDNQDKVRVLRDTEPYAVLGGTVYIYKFD